MNKEQVEKYLARDVELYGYCVVLGPALREIGQTRLNELCEANKWRVAMSIGTNGLGSDEYVVFKIDHAEVLA